DLSLIEINSRKFRQTFNNSMNTAHRSLATLVFAVQSIVFSTSALAQDLRPTENAAQIAIVRELYAAVEGTNLTTTSKELVSGDESLQILMKRGSDKTGSVRRIVLNVATGDHGGFTTSIYYYENSNMPGFVLWQDSYWRFDPNNPDQTIDFFKEYRFYYSKDGQLLRQLVKEYQGTGEAAIKANAAKAQNRPLATTGTYAFEFWKHIANLNITTDQFVGKRVEDILGNFDEMVR
ncbi:MAG: hypothetical protein AAGH89_14840, partial [Verrucomicrobiota bacterium]